MVKTFSKIVTNVFQYYTWVPIFIIAAVSQAGLRTEHFKSTIIILHLVDVLAPIAVYIFLLNGGRIKDANLIKREDRPQLFGITTFLIFIATIISYRLGSPLFFQLHLVVFIFMLTLTVITMFFKISAHMFINTFFIFLLNYLYEWKLLWLFLIVPVVAFARLNLKAHTRVEVVLGTIVGFVEPYLLLKLLKLL